MAQHVHPRVLQWLRSNYPRPQLDPDWLKECSNWLIHDKNLSPASNFQPFVDTLEEQLLSSDLRDSMSHGTGLPTHIARLDTNTILTGPPVLVEIAAMTEIAHSAFSLEQIRVARDERMRVDGAESTDADEGDIDVDEGPPPKYPRGMLRLELTDGLTSLPAIEYRHLPSIILGVTSLGCKMQLKNVKIRNGIAWLEPDTIVFKGFSNKEREVNQKLDFARGLRARMGLPLEPVAQPAQMNASPPLAPRSPLRDISPPPQPDPRHNDDEILENRKRRIPSSSATLTDSHTSTQFENRPIASSSRVASASARAGTTTISPYFPSASQHGVRDSQTRPLLAQRSIIDMTLEDTGEPVTSQHRFHPSTRSDHEMQIDWEQKVSTTIDGPLGGMSLGRQARHADSKGKGKAESIQVDDDEFGEDNFFMDQALLESLDRADMEARRISNEPMPNPPPSTAGSTSIPCSNGAHSRNVIEIADDDDCDDKENIPVATRHVRRRTDTDRRLGSQPVMSGDVIDLSDSD